MTHDRWHLAQRFDFLPTLNKTFIEEDPHMQRILVCKGEQDVGGQFTFDTLFNFKMARPMPMYSVPGLIDHF